MQYYYRDDSRHVISSLHSDSHMTTWHEHFLEMAQLISTRSKDPSTKVGAIIVDNQRRIIGSGYNGFPRGVDDAPERYQDRPLKLQMVVHAEANAILNAVKEVKDCTLYCTFFPCPHCAGLIIQSGITSVIAKQNPSDDRYLEQRTISIRMFAEAHIFWMAVS